MYMSTLLAKLAAIHEALGLPPGLVAGPMLAAACEAMGIQPGQGATLPPIMAAARGCGGCSGWDGIKVKK